MMSEIYRKSFLTIAAASAENHQSGFLDPRTNIAMELSPTYKVLPGIKVREVIDNADSMLIKDPLSTRAWAFQERLVPQRILSFGVVQMSWHCNGSALMECGYEPQNWKRVDINRELYHSTLKPETHQLSRGKRVGNSKPPNIYAFWRRSVVPTYTRLELTKERDRLPALSAIANEIRRITQDEYLAGIWRQDLLTSLLWTSASKEAPKPGWLPSEYRAPSWSWASIESSSITFPKNVVRDKFNIILDANCQTTGVNPTGEVSHGFIRLLCRWLPATLKVDMVSKKIPKISPGMISADASVSPEPDETHKLFGFPTPCVYLWECFPDVPLKEDQNLNAEETPTNTIQRSDLKPGANRPAISGAVSCLLLTQVGQEAFFMIVGKSRTHSGAFERLGILKAVPEDRFWEDWYGQLKVSEFLVV